jgi:hypothetical protein
VEEMKNIQKVRREWREDTYASAQVKALTPNGISRNLKKIDEALSLLEDRGPIGRRAAANGELRRGRLK